MKKILILLVSLVAVIALIWFLLPVQDTALSGNSLSKPADTIKSTIDSEPQDSAEKLERQTEEAANQDEPTQQVEEDSVAFCTKKLEEQYPEINKRFHEIVAEFYLTEEEMMGESVYQNMSFETLRALADANDTKAMMAYGSEKVWYSGLGVRMSGQNMQYRSHEQTREVVESHQIDLEGVKEGENYLYKAAVFGKVGSIFELNLLLDMVARQLDKKSENPKLINELLVKSLAYRKLLGDIHENDPVLKRQFVDSMSWMDSIQRIYADREDYADIRKQIETEAQNMYLELKVRWEYDREYYGFDIYPDYLQGELEEYGDAYLGCFH